MNMTTVSSTTDAATLDQVCSAIGPLNESAMEAARARQGTLTKPAGSLGRLEELSIQLAGITGTDIPEAPMKSAVIVMAGDHGVAAEGVSLFPQEVTPQMVFTFIGGGAGINVLARHVGADVIVVDVGVAAELEEHPLIRSKKVALGTQNMTQGPAMTREQAVRALCVGIEVAREQIDAGVQIFGTGDMGIANTTPSAALTAVIAGGSPEDVTGRGTGIDDDALNNKVDVIKRAIAVNQPDPRDGIDTLAKVGGFEIAGLAGVILAAAAARVPVVIDGFISGAAALVACAIEPKAKSYLIPAHQSVEVGHKTAMNHLELKPLLNLGLRLGEGTGAAMAISIVQSAAKILAEMATFADAGVSGAKE